MSGPGKASSLAARAAEWGLFRNRLAGPALIVATAIRIIAGLLFVTSTIPKITARQEEIKMFGMFGLPRSSTLVYLVATLEIGCGLLLRIGLLTRLAAAAMAANMAGAVLTAGTHVGGPIHLGLAPALLAAMLFLLWVGPGLAALDRRRPDTAWPTRRPIT